MTLQYLKSIFDKSIYYNGSKNLVGYIIFRFRLGKRRSNEKVN